MNKLKGIMPRWISQETGLTPISSFLDDDIFIAGYPKSGNTWFQYLLVGLYWGLDPIIAPDPLIQQLVPDVHFKTYYLRFTTPMTFKTHNLPRPEYKRVVYLARDGRDVMVSYYYHLLALQGGHVDFETMVRDGKGLFPCKWHKHVDVWLSNPYNADILLIKYEDLKRDPLHELSRFCDFAGVQRDNTFLERMISRADFSNMKRKEKENPSFRMNKNWDPDKSFIRRGIVGSYLDEMPPEILDTFMSEASEMLRRLQYV